METHAIGIVMYGITAFVYHADPKDADDVIEKECKWFYERLLYWEANIDKVESTWAPFLLNDSIPNKEKLLRLKKEQKQKLESNQLLSSKIKV